MKDIKGRDIKVGDEILYIYRTGIYCYDTKLSSNFVEAVNEEGVTVRDGKSFTIVTECLVVN